MKAKGFAVWEHSDKFGWYMISLYTYGRYGGYLLKADAKGEAMEYIRKAEKIFSWAKYVLRPCMVDSVRK